MDAIFAELMKNGMIGVFLAYMVYQNKQLIDTITNAIKENTTALVSLKELIEGSKSHV